MNAPESGRGKSQNGPRDGESWKSRYYDAVSELDSLERQADDDRKSFRQTLTRLTHLAAGDPAVAALLEPVLELLQGNASAQAIESAVQSVAGEALADAGQRRQAPSTDLVLALTQVASALHPLIDHVAAENITARVHDFDDLAALPGILSHAAGALGHRETTTLADPELGAQVSAGLSRLLGLLPIPASGEQEHQRLLHLIQANADCASLPTLFDQVATHVANITSALQRERASVEALLREVSVRLAEFDDHLVAADQSANEGNAARDRMTQGISAELTQIVEAFHGPENIGTLQIQVQQHLDQLRFHIERFNRTEQDRRKRDGAERLHLQQCIASLEAEAGQLRGELEAAQRAAERDSLTDLPNRRGYDATLDREVARATRSAAPLSLIALDADHFKRINDTYGHPVGDEVLRTLARLIKKSTRSNDYPARVGGEEFFLLLPDTALADAITIAEKLRRRVEKTNFHMNGNPVEVTVSAGVAQFSPDRGANALHEEVDAALYAAKAAGRNRCHPSAPATN